jgi:hypothetical protein
MARNTNATRRPRRATGIPRTHKAALKLGYEPAGLSFNDLSDEHKASFMQLAGGRTGSYCGSAASPDPRYWLVCYKDANGQCNWVHVPRGEPIQDHG